jgi:hypothetical protein
MNKTLLTLALAVGFVTVAAPAFADDKPTGDAPATTDKPGKKTKHTKQVNKEGETKETDETTTPTDKPAKKTKHTTQVNKQGETKQTDETTKPAK